MPLQDGCVRQNPRRQSVLVVLLVTATMSGLVACSGAIGTQPGGAGGSTTGAGGVTSTGDGGGPGAGGSLGTGGARPGTGGTGTGGASSTGGAAGSTGGTPGGTGGAAGVAGGTGGAINTGGFAPCAGNTACAIMTLGDSITFGFGSTTGGGYRVELLNKAVAVNKSIKFVGRNRSGNGAVAPNEGYSGFTIDPAPQSSGGISTEVDGAMTANKPNIILLMAGTNDMHYSIDLSNAPTRLGDLIDQVIRDAPDALLVVATLIPANGAQNTPTQTFNAAIPGVVRTRMAQGKHILMVDQFAAIKVWSNSGPNAMYHDSEHPNDAGYATMAATWWPAILPYLP